MLYLQLLSSIGQNGTHETLVVFIQRKEKKQSSTSTRFVLLVKNVMSLKKNPQFCETLLLEFFIHLNLRFQYTEVIHKHPNNISD